MKDTPENIPEIPAELLQKLRHVAVNLLHLPMGRTGLDCAPRCYSNRMSVAQLAHLVDSALILGCRGAADENPEQTEARRARAASLARLAVQAVLLPDAWARWQAEGRT